MKTSALTPPLSLIMNRMWRRAVTAEIRLMRQRIRDTMAILNIVALGRVVLARREHVIALEPKGRGLVGTTLRYPYEVRDEEPYFEDARASIILIKSVPVWISVSLRPCEPSTDCSVDRLRAIAFPRRFARREGLAGQA